MCVCVCVSRQILPVPASIPIVILRGYPRARKTFFAERRPDKCFSITDDMSVWVNASRNTVGTVKKKQCQSKIKKEAS